MWSPKDVKLALTISPPPWFSIAAIIFYVIVSLLMMIFLFQWRTKTIVKRSLWLEQTVKTRTQQLNQVLLEKEHLFEDTSHELRTPLTLILGHIELILKQKIPANISKHIKQIQQQSDRLLSLVNSLLSLAEINANKNEKHHVLIVPTIEMLIHSYQAKAEQKELIISYTSNIPEHLSVNLVVDSEARIFGNLIDNAIKYSPQKSSIDIELSQSGEQFIFIIKDEGPGFNNINQAQKRFKRENNTQTGSGLGLAIVQQTLNVNQGKMEIQNRQVKGCKITVSLPCALQLNHSSEEKYSEEKSSEEKEAINISPSDKLVLPIQKMNLLIVEDNQYLSELFEESLAQDFNLTLCNNGQNALDFLNQNKDNLPDIILSDVMMPQMNGYQLCYKVKNNDNFKHIPLILLTAKTDEKSRQQGFNMGADDYIGKPFNIESIKIKLFNILKTQNAKKEHLLKYILQNDKKTPEFSNQPESGFVINIKQHLTDNYSKQDYKIEDLITHCHMTETTLNRRLKREFGHSFTTILLRFRLQRSYSMLKRKLKIQGIAEKCGYNSRSYFSKLFKNEYGKTPGEIRASFSKK